MKQKISNEELVNTVKNMLAEALEQPGVTDAEVGGSASSGLMAKVRLREVDVIEFQRDKSLSITVYKGKRKGSASITDLTASAITAAVQAAARIAEFTQEDPFAGLADPKFLAKQTPDLDLYHPAGITPEFAIEQARACEAAALDYSKEITNTDGATFSANDQFYVYGNSNGFLGSYPTTYYSAYCLVIAQRGDSMQRDYDYTVARDVNDLLRLSDVGRRAAEYAIARLGARKIKTCQAPVLYMPKIATALWDILFSAISGGNLFRKSSFLLDRLDTRVFPDFVNITEQPFIPKGLASAPFDSEGVATREKSIITDGILKSYLLGSYSARKLGMETTGNAGRLHNMVVNPGTENFTQLLKKMQRGLVVTETPGNGTNIITGDYSHGAVGFWVENGEIAYPVEEITIASNLNDMFANMIALGNDVDRRSDTITGSVLLDNMTIGGH